jgi:hypothetical protein
MSDIFVIIFSHFDQVQDCYIQPVPLYVFGCFKETFGASVTIHIFEP